MPEELEEAIVRAIEDIPRAVLADAFEGWQKGLETRIESD
jgi:hypothetical protein